MLTRPSLDISLVTYNSARWLENFFSSLAQQTYPTDKINLFIRDNGSTDETVVICNQLKQRYQNIFGKILITHGENLGYGPGQNDNIAKANAEYILITNPDLEFAPDALTNIMQMAIQDSREVAAWELRQKPYEHPKYYNPVTLETSWNSHACVLFRRDSLIKVGCYEKNIFLYGEDVELSYRLRDHGYQLKYCPKAVCWHYSYENAQQIKPKQYFGSKLANIFIRLRYGSVKDIMVSYCLYIMLFFIPKPVPNRVKQLWHNAILIIKNTPYFLATRKQSRDVAFSFNYFDYELKRDGAFYSNNYRNKSTPPLISIIIRTYAGRLAMLKEAVASVQNQTFNNIELIIVEDGTDTVQNFVAQLQAGNYFTAVRYLSLPKCGRSAAGNQGLQAATGDFIAFLDDDDLFFADHLEVLSAELQANPECAATYAISYEVKTKSFNLTDHYQELSYDVMYRQKFSRTLLWQKNYIPIHSVLFRRELYIQYGGFDESLECLEDWHLWLRYSLEHEFLFVAKLTSLYRVDAEKSNLLQRAKLFHQQKNDFLQLQENFLRAQSITSPNAISILNTLKQDHYATRTIFLNVLQKLPFLYMFYPWLRKIHAKLNSLNITKASYD